MDPIEPSKPVKVTYEDQFVCFITVQEAKEKLTGYWKREYIIPMLIDGHVLWTPYAEYTLNY